LTKAQPLPPAPPELVVPALLVPALLVPPLLVPAMPAPPAPTALEPARDATEPPLPAFGALPPLPAASSKASRMV